MKRLMLSTLLVWTASALAQSSNCISSELNLPSTKAAVANVQSASYPELTKKPLGLGTFHSNSDYFRTRFNVLRFFLPVSMHYSVQVNPVLFTKAPPADGVCAILAHELAHVASLSRGNRLRNLGLVRLLSSNYTAAFERKTDLEAIQRGYAEGLKDYRIWVYKNIPANKEAEKHRRYFSPEEIDAIVLRIRQQPEILSYWRKHPPMNLQEVQQSPR